MLTAAVLLLLAAGPGPPTPSGPAATVEVKDDISYEAFMAYDVPVRKQIFVKVSPEAKARLMSTHVDRSLAAFRSKLTPEQVKVVEEYRPLITAAVYEPGDTPEKKALQDVGARARAALGEEWTAQFMTLNGIYPRLPDRSDANSKK